jgi:hypothetical protein
MKQDKVCRVHHCWEGIFAVFCGILRQIVGGLDLPGWKFVQDVHDLVMCIFVYL